MSWAEAALTELPWQQRPSSYRSQFTSRNEVRPYWTTGPPSKPSSPLSAPPPNVEKNWEIYLSCIRCTLAKKALKLLLLMITLLLLSATGGTKQQIRQKQMRKSPQKIKQNTHLTAIWYWTAQIEMQKHAENLYAENKYSPTLKTQKQ